MTYIVLMVHCIIAYNIQRWGINFRQFHASIPQSNKPNIPNDYVILVIIVAMVTLALVILDCRAVQWHCAKRAEAHF